MVDILIAYVAGTERLMRACLASIGRYDAGVDYGITVVTDIEASEEARDLFEGDVGRVVSYSVDNNAIGSQRHASLLDSYMNEAQGLVLTMDSDCLPIGDRWLWQLCGFLGQNTVLPGIRWPWEPPGADVEGIEARIRGNHNWENTWVACQLVDSDWVRTNGLRYCDGDDTGFALAAKAREQGLRMPGWMPTRCALPDGHVDPELNRMMCVVYGDKVVHIGGGSGSAVGRVVDIDGMYDKVVDRILNAQDAGWLLDEGKSHVYRFDREDDVSQYKMNRMYAEMRRYLETHDSLFGS